MVVLFFVAEQAALSRTGLAKVSAHRPGGVESVSLFQALAGYGSAGTSLCPLKDSGRLTFF